MKKFNILIALMFVVTISKAQTIPNAGFENWTNHGTYTDPTSWSSLNFTSGTTCEQGTPGAVGASYLKLTVKSGMPGIAMSSPTYPTGGNPDGFACTARPAYLTGKYKYSISTTDSAGIFIGFSKWNTTTLSQDPVGGAGIYISGGSATSWTNFSIPITFIGGVYPDSAAIELVVGIASTPTNGDYLYVDDLAFSGTVSAVGNIEQTDVHLTIAPNPFNSKTVISFTEEQNNTLLRVLDITGRIVKTIHFSGKELTLEKEDLQTGIYFLHLVDEKNNVYTRQIVVE